MIRRLYELYRFIFPAKPKTPTREQRMALAAAQFRIAKAAYDDACDRGDTRAQHECWQPLFRAQTAIQMAEVGR